MGIFSMLIKFVLLLLLMVCKLGVGEGGKELSHATSVDDFGPCKDPTLETFWKNAQFLFQQENDHEIDAMKGFYINISESDLKPPVTHHHYGESVRHLKLQVGASSGIRSLSVVLEVDSIKSRSCTVNVEDIQVRDNNPPWRMKIVQCINQDDSIVYNWPPETSQIATYVTLDLYTIFTCNILMRIGIVDDQSYLHYFERHHIIHYQTFKNKVKMLNHPRVSMHRLRRDMSAEQEVITNYNVNLVIANEQYIQQLSLDGRRARTTVCTHALRAVAIDYHYRDQLIFWTDVSAKNIMSSNFNGSQVAMVANLSTQSVPDGLAVDWITNKLYWTDTGEDTISVLDLNTNIHKTLFNISRENIAAEPRAIVIDPLTRWMYWTDWGYIAKIEKSSMDGRNRSVIHNTGLVWPNGLTLDFQNQVLYWADASLDIIESSNVDGSNRMLITDYNVLHPFGLALFDGILYFTDWSGPSVKSVDPRIGNVSDVLRGLNGQPFGIKAVSEQREPIVFNPCKINNGGCSHLCLLSAVRLGGYSCNCPNGMTLDHNGFSCISLNPPEVFQQPEIHLINFTCPRTLLIQTINPQGSCVSAGHRNCCIANDCQGEPNDCFCDNLCILYGDCCSDANTSCDYSSLQFIEQPKNRAVYEGDRAQFVCSVQSSNEPKTFSWEFRSSASNLFQVIADIMGPRVRDKYVVEIGQSSSKLMVLTVDVNDAGAYNCRVSAVNESIQAHGYLDVLVAPQDLVITGSDTAIEGEAITLTCTVFVSPKPTVTWLKRNAGELRLLMNSSRISVTNTYDGLTFTHHSNLVIQGAQEADNGEYLCEIQNAHVTLPLISSQYINISATNECSINGVASPCSNGGLCVDLFRGYRCICSGGYQGPHCTDLITDIAAPPNIMQPPLTMISDLANPINLTCNASGSPAPTYKWYKDGILIPGEQSPFLYIAEVLPNDRGNYSCRAVNINGQRFSEPALLTIPGVYQYSARLQLLAGMDNTDEVLLMIANSNLSYSSTFIHSVRIVSSSGPREVTIHITVVQSTERGNNSFESTQAISGLKSDLYSQLLLISSVQVIEIARYDGCNRENFRGYEWPEINLGTSASVPCPCAEYSGSLAGRIFRYCTGTFSQQAQWSTTLDSSRCTALNSAQTGLLCEAAQNVSSASLEASKLVTEITATPSNLSAADVSVSIAVIDQLTTDAIANPEIRKNYLQIIDNIQQADRKIVFMSQNATNSSSRVLESLNQFTDAVDLNGTEDRTVFGYSTYALQIQSIDSESVKAGGHALAVNLGSVDEALNSDQIRKEDLITGEGLMSMLINATASVYIPTDSLINSVNSCSLEMFNTSQQRLSHSIFLSDILFQTHFRNNYRIGSIIIAARIQCLDGVFLPVPVRTTFRTNPKVANNASNRTCSRWDSGAWSTSGCTKVSVNGDTTTCECSYMAHFGILFDLSPVYTFDTAALALTIFSYVGLATSLLCLSIFLLTYFSVKQLRSNIHGQILINMSLALMGLYILFLISGHVASLPPLCGISSALLQYFLLVFFGWTAVEAVWLYLKLVKVFGIQSYIARFSLKAGIPTWVVPMLIVILTAGPGYSYYANPFYCRATEWPFWVGTVLPFGLVYIFNWIMFVIIMVSICKHSRSIGNSKREGKLKSRRDNLMIAVTLALVFGLGWAIGLAATSLPIKEITFIFQIMFCILVGAQGVLIFFLQGVRNKDFRRFWRQIFYTVVHKTHLSSVLTSIKTSVGTPTHRGTDMAGADTLSSEKVCYSVEKGKATTLASLDDLKQPGINIKANEAYGSLPGIYTNTSITQQPSEYDEVHIYDPVAY